MYFPLSYLTQLPSYEEQIFGRYGPLRLVAARNRI